MATIDANTAVVKSVTVDALAESTPVMVMLSGRCFDVVLKPSVRGVDDDDKVAVVVVVDVVVDVVDETGVMVGAVLYGVGDVTNEVCVVDEVRIGVGDVTNDDDCVEGDVTIGVTVGAV